MRIVSSTIAPIAFPQGRRGWTLRLVDDAGRIGTGEASPLPGYSPDDTASCERALANVAQRLVETDDGDAIATVEAMLAPAAESFSGTPAARFAVETALFDLIGKVRGVAVAEVLGGRPHNRVALNGVVGIDGDLAHWVADAKELMARDIRVVKIKIGRSNHSFESERDALHRLRDTLPRDARMRLDANGSFGEDARDQLGRLSDLAPEFVEEPTRGEALAKLGECAIPWAADESLAIPSLVDRFLDHSACEVVILKPAFLGGLIYARKIALRARARGLGVVVTHLFDGMIGHAAACELALSIDAPLACGLDRYEGIEASPHLMIPGFVSTTGRPGLGLTS